MNSSSSFIFTLISNYLFINQVIILTAKKETIYEKDKKIKKSINNRIINKQMSNIFSCLSEQSQPDKL
jgi:hypothetical protein